MSTHSHEHRTAYWPGRFSALLPFVLFVWFLYQMPFIVAGERMTFSVAWIPSLGVSFAIVIDGLSNLFTLIITGVGTLVTIYADAYMAGHKGIARFYIFLHAFMLSMLGLVLSDNLLVLFVFWELTTLFSFLLIGFLHDSEEARSSARQALLLTGGGGLLLLVGILLAGWAAGTYSLSGLTANAVALRNHALYLPILLCMLAGAFTKSAQVPFHFWLPEAMTAPTPISTYLHSATMVKAGIYLLMRLHPILGGTMIWMTTLVIVGAATAVWGAILSLGQNDLKRVLAYTTVMALGTITMFLSGLTTPTLTAAITFLLVHALYKSSLFMVVGNIDHQSGTRRLDKIGGIGRSMPVTTVAATMAALSMAGFPLFLGFVGKEIMYKGALATDVFPGLATSAALTANALMTAVAAILTFGPFWSKKPRQQTVAETPWQMWIGPLTLGGLGLGFGLIPDTVGRWLVEPAVLAIHPTTEIVKLKLFYGFNKALLLSVLTLFLGGLLYWQRRQLKSAVGRITKMLPLTMVDLFNRWLKSIVHVAEFQTRVLQSGSLFRYLLVIIVVLVLTVGWFLIVAWHYTPDWQPSSLAIWQVLLIAVMLTASVIVVCSVSRLMAICALGVIGAGIAVIFLSFGAPDVALTQLLVETLTLIIVAIILLRLPGMTSKRRRSWLQRGLSLFAAFASGVLVAGLLIAVSSHDVDRTISRFYEQASYVKAHGRNIVNVILVDFRSLDTFGEIIVVAASALAGSALIRKRRTPS